MTRFILLCSLIGLVINMSLSGLVTQPDWSLAILLAALLSDRQAWHWVLPGIWFHDIILYWSAWTCFPYFIFTSIVLFYSDKRLGPGQHQRWFGLFFSCLSILLIGISVWDWLLTIMLTIWLWFLLSAKRERDYVEPA